MVLVHLKENVSYGSTEQRADEECKISRNNSIIKITKINCHSKDKSSSHRYLVG